MAAARRGGEAPSWGCSSGKGAEPISAVQPFQAFSAGEMKWEGLQMEPLALGTFFCNSTPLSPHWAPAAALEEGWL